MTDVPSQKEYWSGQVGSEWAAHADRLDAMLQPMTEHALRLAAFQPGQHVLDIGCGAGGTSLEIARAVQPGGSVAGVDLSPQMLEVARVRAAGQALPVEFLEADAATAKLGRNFDAAFSRFGMMFFEQPAAAFAHLRHELRSGGRLTFVCWRALPENTWATAPIEAVKPLLKSPSAPPDPDAPGPFALADLQKIERILADAGWRDVEITSWDGAINIGGGGTLQDAVDFLLRIGPCARTIADQALDSVEASRRLTAALAPLHGDRGVALAAACWVVRATA